MSKKHLATRKDFSFTKILIATAVFTVLNTMSLTGMNFFPNGGFDGNWRPAWNRMIGENYLPDTPGWKLAQEDGNQFLVSDSSGQALELQFEGPSRNVKTVLAMRCPDGTCNVTVEFFSYSYLQPLPMGKKVFAVGKQWKDFTLKSTRDNRMRMQNMAPLKIRITPPKGSVVMVDNVRYEGNQVPVPAKPIEVPSNASSKEKPGMLDEKIPFTVRHEKTAAGVPFTVVLPFGAGDFKCAGDKAGVQVRNSDGKAFPAQGRVLSRWPVDGSVRALAVDTEADLKKGDNQFLAEAGSIPEKGDWSPQLTLHLYATDAMGNAYAGICTPDKSEIDGPLRRALYGEAKLKSPGMPDIPVQCRTGFFRGVPDVEIEVSIRNPYGNVPFVLGSAEVVVKSGKAGKAEKKSIVTSPGDKPLAPGALSVTSAGGVFIMPQAAERHPSAVEVDANGDFKGTLWSGEWKQLCMSYNIALTRRFIWSPDQNVASRFGGEAPIAMAEPARFGKTRYFLLPLGTIDRKNYPYAAKRIDESFQQRYTKEGHMNACQNGLFNYGDRPGDGGWSNLESFEDYAEIMRAIVYGDLGRLAFAFDRAIHYRDIDTFGGLCHYHMSNHVAGGTSYSHSWCQGIICHYLLTGNPRSLAVLKEVAQGHLNTPIDNKEISEARSLSRFLLGLTDLYGVLGWPELKERFYAQVKHAEKTNLTEKRHDDTLFPWHARLDPYQVWYGACAFMEMYMLTGEKSLLDSFHREMKASFNTEFYYLDLKECWPGLPPEKGFPIHLGFLSRHRGSLIYPLLVFQSKIDKNPELLKLAQQAAYTDWCTGRMSGGVATDFFRLSGQEGKRPEAELLAEAKELVFNAASPKILNSDFSLSPDWFVYWHLPALRQMGYDSAVKEWPLAKDKDFKKLDEEYLRFNHKVSPWRNYSRRLGYLDRDDYGEAAPALRVQLSSKWSLGIGATVAGAYVRMDPGRWRWRASFKSDETLDQKSFARMQLFIPGERKQFLSVNFNDKPDKINLQNHGPVILCNDPVDHQASNATFKILPGKKPGWKILEMDFTLPTPMIGMPMFYLYLAPGHVDSFTLLDDFSLEKI